MKRISVGNTDWWTLFTQPISYRPRNLRRSKTFRQRTQTSTLSPWLQDSSFKYETQQPNCRWYGKYTLMFSLLHATDVVAFWLASSLCDVTITTATQQLQGWPAVTFGGEIKYGGRQLPSQWRTVNDGFCSSSSDIHSFLRRYIIRATLWSKWEPPEWSNWMASFKIYGGRCLFTHGQPKLCV